MSQNNNNQINITISDKENIQYVFHYDIENNTKNFHMYHKNNNRIYDNFTKNIKNKNIHLVIKNTICDMV